MIRTTGLPWWPAVKNLLANAEDVGSSPGSGRPPEKEMATHSNSFAWEIPWTEEPDRLQSMGMQKVGHDWKTNTYRDFQDDKMNALSLVL